MTKRISGMDWLSQAAIDRQMSLGDLSPAEPRRDE
jgi:hypothetical protein